MWRHQFRLTLEPGQEGITRLAQLHQYAEGIVEGERSLVGPLLREKIAASHPQRTVTQTLDMLVGKGIPQWDLEGDAKGSPRIVISTRGRGMAFSAIAQIVEQIAPEALTKPMFFEPIQKTQSGQKHSSLH